MEGWGRPWSALPIWAQLSLVVIATRRWALGAMVLGTYFPRTTPGYWHHPSGNGLFYQHVP